MWCHLVVVCVLVLFAVWFYWRQHKEKCCGDKEGMWPNAPHGMQFWSYDPNMYASEITREPMASREGWGLRW